jgi:hypothetical protein
MKNLILVALLTFSSVVMADVEIIEAPKPAPAPAPQVQPIPQPQPMAHYEQQVILDPYAPFREAHYASLRQAQIAHGNRGEVMRVVARTQVTRETQQTCLNGWLGYSCHQSVVPIRHVIGFDVTVYANGRYYTVPMDHQPPVGATIFFGIN